jgi:hypothetical protein
VFSREKAEKSGVLACDWQEGFSGFCCPSHCESIQSGFLHGPITLYSEHQGTESPIPQYSSATRK